MLSPNDLTKGSRIIIDGKPHEVLEASSMFKARGHSTVQVKIKNLIAGTITQRTLHPSDKFEEADITDVPAHFVYTHRDQFVFCHRDNPGNRFELSADVLGNKKAFLTEKLQVTAKMFQEDIIDIQLPIKLPLKVTEAPPGIKGDTSSGGTKIVTLETGYQVSVPLFIEEGDTLEINTETGAYTRRL